MSCSRDARRYRMTFRDRKSTRLNSSHTVIYTLSLHDALPIFGRRFMTGGNSVVGGHLKIADDVVLAGRSTVSNDVPRSEEHTSELQSHRDLHSFPTRRSSDLRAALHDRG